MNLASGGDRTEKKRCPGAHKMGTSQGARPERCPYLSNYHTREMAKLGENISSSLQTQGSQKG